MFTIKPFGGLSAMSWGLALLLTAAAGQAVAEGEVRVTPLGSHDGEF